MPANVEAPGSSERSRQADYMRGYKKRVRAEVFAYYGTCCACCGTTENLSIDHVDGNGAEHRQELFGDQTDRGGYRFQLWLRRNGFPPGYQVLCVPCNTSKKGTEACRLSHVEGLKRCTYPGHEGLNPLPLGMFNLRSDQPDGRQSRCRACANYDLRVKRHAGDVTIAKETGETGCLLK